MSECSAQAVENEPIKLYVRPLDAKLHALSLLKGEIAHHARKLSENLLEGHEAHRQQLLLCLFEQSREFVEQSFEFLNEKKFLLEMRIGKRMHRIKRRLEHGVKFKAQEEHFFKEPHQCVEFRDIHLYTLGGAKLR